MWKSTSGFLHHDFAQALRELVPRAVMHAVSERCVHRLRAVHVEAVRIGELCGIAVRGGYDERQWRTSGYRHPFIGESSESSGARASIGIAASLLFAAAVVRRGLRRRHAQR